MIITYTKQSSDETHGTGVERGVFPLYAICTGDGSYLRVVK